MGGWGPSIRLQFYLKLEYYAYYTYANIQVINRVRAAKGLNTFAYRPHCGESGRVEHLASSFLLADGIAHGVRPCNRRNQPGKEYTPAVPLLPCTNWAGSVSPVE